MGTVVDIVSAATLPNDSGHDLCVPEVAVNLGIVTEIRALEERSPTAAGAESEHRMIQQIVNLKMKRNAHSFPQGRTFDTS